MSCPVSPTGARLLPSRTRTLDVTGRVPPSPIVSPHTASGPSTPATSSGGAISFHKNKQPMFSHETVGMIQKSQDGFHYQEPKHDPLLGSAHAPRDIISSDNNALANHYRRAVPGASREFHNVPQMQSRDYVRLNTSLDRKPRTPMPGNINGF